MNIVWFYLWHVDNFVFIPTHNMFSNVNETFFYLCQALKIAIVT